MSLQSRYVFSLPVLSSIFDNGPQDILISFGEQPPSGCSFDFFSVLVDVETTLETAATSIVSFITVKSRHQTILNIFASAIMISESFNIALLPQEVLAIAGSSIRRSPPSTCRHWTPSLVVR